MKKNKPQSENEEQKEETKKKDWVDKWLEFFEKSR